MDTRLYQVIKRPIITEKGLGVKETQHTVVFEVASDATKTEIKEAVQRVFKVKVDHESFAAAAALRVSAATGRKRTSGWLKAKK
jgi:large subunit ribosomal protein L23